MPVIVSARGTDINLFPSFKLIRPIIRWTLSQADSVIAVSGALKDAMVRLDVNPDKIHVIPNGVNAELFQPMDREQARKNLNLPTQAPLLVSVGALIRPKGHLTLIRAFAVIALRLPELRLYILGEGPLPN